MKAFGLGLGLLRHCNLPIRLRCMSRCSRELGIRIIPVVHVLIICLM